MRGVHKNPLTLPDSALGSSPHARGPLITFMISLLLVRIIPACAGSTERQRRGEMMKKDHPRMRGVHVVDAATDGTSTGSSPHARGPLIYGKKWEAVARIIPACAGSTPVPLFREWLIKDHPRMRGVHHSPILALFILIGSSPHARGPR